MSERAHIEMLNDHISKLKENHAKNIDVHSKNFKALIVGYDTLTAEFIKSQKRVYELECELHALKSRPWRLFFVALFKKRSKPLPPPRPPDDQL